MKKVEFKFQINDKVTAVNGLEGTVEALCHGKNGNFYRVRIALNLMNSYSNFPESELRLGWDVFQHESA